MRNKIFFITGLSAVFSMSFFLAAQDLMPLDDMREEGAAQSIQENNLPAAAGPLGNNKISLDIKGMDILDVLQMLSKRAGMNLVIGKNVTGRVALFLKEVEVRDAFEIVLLANDLAYDKKGDILNVMTQRDYELAYGQRYQDKKQMRIVSLKYAKAVDLAIALNQIKTNIGRIVLDEHSNTLVLIDEPQKIAEMENFLNQVDAPVETRLFHLNYAQADKLSPKVQEVLTKGVGALRVDERTNKIVVTDYLTKLEEVARLITAFDEKTLQVVIDAQIVEISPQKDQFAMGVDWDYWLQKNVRLINSLPAPTLTDLTTIPTKLSFGVAAADTAAKVTSTGRAKSILELLRVIGKTKILSSPRIMALNNQEAKILVGTKEAYVTSTTSLSGEASVTSQSVNFVEVGIKLYVTPTINREGFVTMKIRPEISSSKRTDIVSEGKVTQIPIVTTSEAETVITVKDGATIIIAGLKKDQREQEVKKFPLLGDIPLLGLFFRNVKDEVIKNELVIFLSPHIVTGEEFFAYDSLTKDKDIEAIAAGAKITSGPKETIGFSTMREYKKFIFEGIKTVSLGLNAEGGPLKGKVKARFIVSGNGQLKSAPQILASADRRLSDYVRTAIKDASPFPSFPAGFHELERSFVIVVDF